MNTMTDKTAVSTTASRPRVLIRAAVTGAAAGLVGVGAMTLGEKAEQAVTGRPNSYAPARTLQPLLGRHPDDADRPFGWNHPMHYGTGATLGALRGVWAVTGIRGAHTPPEWAHHPRPGRAGN